eukprot:361432-Chlamydomonas_euryale.AAC.3
MRTRACTVLAWHFACTWAFLMNACAGMRRACMALCMHMGIAHEYTHRHVLRALGTCMHMGIVHECVHRHASCMHGTCMRALSFA